MEDQPIKRGRGRPRILTDEQRIQNKTKYMLNKEFFCEICNNGKNYTLAGRSCHLKTKKHKKNIAIDNFMKVAVGKSYKEIK